LVQKGFVNCCSVADCADLRFSTSREIIYDWHMPGLARNIGAYAPFSPPWSTTFSRSATNTIVTLKEDLARPEERARQCEVQQMNDNSNHHGSASILAEPEKADTVESMVIPRPAGAAGLQAALKQPNHFSHEPAEPVVITAAAEATGSQCQTAELARQDATPGEMNRRTLLARMLKTDPFDARVTEEFERDKGTKEKEQQEHLAAALAAAKRAAALEATAAPEANEDSLNHPADAIVPFQIDYATQLKFTEAEVQHAALCMLRSPELAELALIGNDGVGPCQPTPATALIHNYPTVAIIWRYVADRQEQHRSIPVDKQSLLLDLFELSRDPQHRLFLKDHTKLLEIAEAAFDPKYNVIDVDFTRRLICRMLRQILILDQRGRIYSTGDPDDEMHVKELERIASLEEDIKAALDSGTDEWSESLEDEQDDEPDIQIVRNVFEEGYVGLFCGRNKTMKTLLSLDMGVSLATGTPFLGHNYWGCEKRRVGFFSAESGRRKLRKRFKTIIQAKQRGIASREAARIEEIERDAKQNFRLGTRVPDLSDTASIQSFMKHVKKQRIQVVFIDPLFMALGIAAKDLSNSALTTAALARLNEPCVAAGITLVFVHHTAGDRARAAGKDAHKPIKLQDAAYPGVSNYMRQWIAVNEAADYDATRHKSQLWLNIGGSGDQAGGVFHVGIDEGVGKDCWAVTVQTEADHYQHAGTARLEHVQQVMQEQAERVASFILQHPGGVSVSAMARDRTMLQGIGVNRVNDALGLIGRNPRYHLWNERRTGGEVWCLEVIGCHAAEESGQTGSEDDDNDQH